MGRKVMVGITEDYFDRDGNLIIPGPGLKLLDEMPEIEYEPLPKVLPEVSPERIQGFDIVLTRRPRWTQQSLAGNKQLLSIHKSGVGHDKIDVPALSKAGVMLFTTPKGTRRPMAVAVMTLILTLSTRIRDKEKLVREGRWNDKDQYHGYGLTGKSLGLIGVGNVGHEIFRLAKPFDMKHIACDPYVAQNDVVDVDVKLVDMDTLLAESDFLSINCPLTEETQHMIGEKELKKMKNTAFLINTARGRIVKESALVKALQKGWINGAGIDVFEQEPTPPDNPLLKMNNVIATPHALCFSDEMFIDRWEENIRQISQIIHGEVPEGLVNHEVWEQSEFQSKLKEFHVSLK